MKISLFHIVCYRGIDTVLRPANIDLRGFKRVVFADRNMLQGGGVEDQIDILHRPHHAFFIGDIPEQQPDPRIAEVEGNIMQAGLVVVEDPYRPDTSTEDLFYQFPPDASCTPGDKDCFSRKKVRFSGHHRAVP